MQCANPLCATETIYFRGGSLHWIDRDAVNGSEAQAEHLHLVWLCPACTHCFVVETWRTPGQQLRAVTHRSAGHVRELPGIAA
jgi:hypothetical protein